MANKNFEVKHGLSVGGTERITSAGAGSFTDLTLSGDLNITGDVNSVSVTDLDVTDKTITLGKGQTESNSGGSGIVIDGSSASMLWDESNGEFDFNNPLSIVNSIGGDTVLNLTGSYGSGNNVALLGFARSGGAVSGDIRYVDASTDMEIGTGTAHAFSLKTSGTRRVKIHSGGKVDVGGSGGLYGLLTVTQASGADTDEGGIGIVDSSNGRSLRLYCSSTTSFINSGNGGGGNLVLNENAGNVGIGQNSPGYALDVKSSNGPTTARFANSDGEDTLVRIIAGNYNTELDARLFLGESDPYGMTLEYDGVSNLGYIGMNDNVQPTAAYSKRIAMPRSSNYVYFPSGINVGVGTSTPASPLTVYGDGIGIRLDGTANTTRRIFFRSTTSSNPAEIYADGSLKLWTEDSGTSINLVPKNGVVNIGDSNADQFLALDKPTTGTNGILFKNAGNNKGKILLDANEDMQFFVNNTTGAATIKENGDVLLGNTVVNPASGFSNQKGFGYDFSHGTVEIAVDSDTTCLTLGRNHGNNGVMTVFRKQGTSFAELGIEGGDSLYIQAGTSSGSGILCHGSGAKVLPARQGTSIDATIDLGQASRRWKKLWCQKIDATDANGNTSVGYESHNVLGATGNSGDANTAIGFQANEKLTTGSNNIAAGYRAGMNQTSGNYNTSVGVFSAYTNTNGSRNTALGYQAYYSGSGNDHNTAVGNRAMVSASTVGSATAVGSQALEDISTGHYCTAVGMRAGLNITSGQSNSCVGVDSLEDTTTGQFNSALGSNAGANITTGSNNLMLGYRAGKSGQPGGTVTSHSNRVCLGDSAISELNCQVSLSVASDQRDKTDFTDLNIGLDFVKGLKPYTFKWDKRANYVDWDKNPDTDLLTITNDGTHKEDQLDIGFKAQDVEALEEAAGYSKDTKTNLTYALSADEKQYSMKYEKLVPILVKAIQELEARVKELEG